MTEDLEDLIEQIRQANEETLRDLLALFQIEDPVARFRAMDRNESTAMAWALPRAKQITIEEMKNSGKSLEAIGNLLGLSRQRVHQLLNPDPRRSFNARKSSARAV